MSEHPTAERRGGVLVRYGDASGRDRLGFVPSEVADRVTPLSARREVPGLCPPAVGVALAEGEVVTVLELGSPVDAPPASYRPGAEWSMPGSDRALMCTIGGQRVAVTGGAIVATGVFDGAPGRDGIVWRGAVVDVLDVRALYRRAEAAIWESRARAGRPRADVDGGGLAGRGRAPA